jgi:replication factor C subunit 3/5
MGVALKHVAKCEKFDLPDSAVFEIVKDARGNLRKAILVLETLKMQS